MGPKTIEKIEAHGVSSIEKLADMTPEQLTAIPGIGEKMVEKIQLSVAAHFQSIEQQAVEGAQPAELEEQPGEAEQLASEGSVEEAAPVEAAPEELDIAAEQHNEVNQEAAPQTQAESVEAVSEEAGASESENVERKEKSTQE